MAVSIWEGNKASDLIDAVNNLNINRGDFTNEAKKALMNLLRHVAYTDTSGQELYNVLYHLLIDEEPVRESWTWNSSNGVLSGFEGITSYNNSGATESIVNNYMQVFAPGGDRYMRYTVGPISDGNVRITTELNFQGMTADPSGCIRFSVQSSDGTVAAKAHIIKTSGNAYSLCAYVGDNSTPQVLAQISPNEWNKISIELSNNKQTISLNDTTVLNNAEPSSSQVNNNIIISAFTENISTSVYLKSLLYEYNF